MPQVAGIRRMGAASLDLAYVAAGRYDAYWELDLKAWDIAAGMLLVTEAGGFVTDYVGRAKVLDSGEVLATNDKLQLPMQKLLQTSRRSVAERAAQKKSAG
jgi:myo-inositol-1(or 4)-monophosphatase